jgi:hypothetical protein
VAPAAQHKAAIERALSTTVPLRLQHSRPVEIAARLMADHGLPVDEALDRATMRLHAEEGTAEAGRISDVIGKDAFDEAQRVPASPDLAPPAPGVGRGHAATEEQARPDGEYAPGDRAAQGGDETPASYGPAPRVAREGLSPPAPEPASLLSRLASPVTDIPHEIYEAGAESLGAVNTYLNPFSEDYRNGMEAERDKWIGTGPGSFLGTGKGLLAALGVPFSPATGIFRSLFGHPLSVIMPTATPQEQERMRAAGVPEDMIPGQTREENYQKIKRDVDVAMMALGPRGSTPRGAIPRGGPHPPARPPDTAAAQSGRMNSGARASGPFDSGARPAAGQHAASATEAKSAYDGARAVNDTAGPPNKPTEPVPVYFDPNKHPQAAGHAKDAQNRGAPDVRRVSGYSDCHVPGVSGEIVDAKWNRHTLRVTCEVRVNLDRLAPPTLSLSPVASNELLLLRINADDGKPLS